MASHEHRQFVAAVNPPRDIVTHPSGPMNQVGEEPLPPITNTSKRIARLGEMVREIEDRVDRERTGYEEEPKWKAIGRVGFRSTKYDLTNFSELLKQSMRINQSYRVNHDDANSEVD